MNSSSIPEHEHVFPLSTPSLDSEEQDIHRVRIQRLNGAYPNPKPVLIVSCIYIGVYHESV